MIGRIIWIATLIGVGAVTTGLQLDRAADSSPALAPLVPEAFRSYAQAQIAATAVQAGDTPVALAAAEELVRSRPLPAENLTLLAAAQAKAGQTEKAGFSIQIAAQRGWRDPVAQETVLRLALEAGDKAEAARRYGALFRREETPDALLTELGLKVLGEPGGEGRKTLAGIIAGADRWHELFLQRGARVMPADAFAEVVAMAAERGARFDCGTLRMVAEGVSRRDGTAAAGLAPVMARRCPS
ncbi:MAG: hypothetical protein KAF27_10790 [Porphyrobacter sp.]|nr:hypothetical protein [Porphyrobacter sp.]